MYSRKDSSPLPFRLIVKVKNTVSTLDMKWYSNDYLHDTTFVIEDFFPLYTTAFVVRGPLMSSTNRLGAASLT
jgi:hypothetical protein